MLDDRDEQVLAAMERDLAAADPTLRTRLERPRPATWWPLAAAVAGLVAAVGLVLLGLVGNAFLLLVVALSPLAARAWRRGFPRQPRGASGHEAG